MEEKELMRRDLAYILKLDEKVDYANPSSIEQYLNYIHEKNIFSTNLGKRYALKLNMLFKGEENNQCVICSQAIQGNNDSALCSMCLQKYKKNNQKQNENMKNTAYHENKTVADAGDFVNSAVKTGKDFTGKALNQFAEKINTLAGGEGQVELKFKDLFSAVFKRHEESRAEEIFICGTKFTTPAEKDIVTEWPKPWIYSRVALYMLIALSALILCFTEFNNPNVLPGIMVLGSTIVPFAVLLFFFEVNAPRNISIFTTVKIFCVGGCASLFVTLIIFELFPVGDLNYIGAILVGIIEEIGKMLIVVFYISKMKNSKYLLNGMLIGAAVGAGFAAFESAGYCFRFFRIGNFDKMMDVLILRGLLAPGGHVTWAAMSGFALMLVKENQPFKKQMLFDKKFLSIFAVPVIMHALWDMPIKIGGDIPVVQLVLLVMAWIVIVVFLQNGLNQINKQLSQ